MPVGNSVRERPVMVALIGAAGAVLAAIVGIIGVILGRDGGGPPAPTPSPPTQAEASGVTSTSPGTASTTSPPSDHQRLLSYLPETVTNCTPADPYSGALAGVECAVTPGVIAVNANVTFFLYDSVEASRRAFRENVPAAVAVSVRVCPDQPDRSDYLDPAGEPIGLLACWVNAETGEPYIVWTTDDPGVMATALGPPGATVADLWPFWQNTPISSSN